MYNTVLVTYIMKTYFKMQLKKNVCQRSSIHQLSVNIFWGRLHWCQVGLIGIVSYRRPFWNLEA